MYKKILASLLLFAVVGTSLLLPVSVNAQEWWRPSHAEFNQRVNGTAIPENEIFGERYTHAQVYWIVYSLINFALGTQTMQCAADGAAAGGGSEGIAAYTACLIRNGIDLPDFSWSSPSVGPQLATRGDIGFLALGVLSDQILSARPASGVQYVAGVIRNTVGMPEAHAQQGGFGFGSLSPVQNIWVAARNAAYALMTLAIIALAFMVMFRTKISPQASVTVQVAIPRIIIGLLLITFSFAIAGFIIDLAYVVQGLIAAILTSSNLIFAGTSPVFIFDRMNDVSTGIVSYGFATLAAVLVLPAGVGLSGLIFGPISVIVGVIILIVVIILFLIALIRIFWLLLRAYVMILFLIIGLPFAALGYVVSTSSNPFMMILRNLVGQVSIFVTVTVMVMFAHIVFWSMAAGGPAEVIAGAGMFNPYRVVVGTLSSGTLGLPGFQGVPTHTIAIFVGLVTLLMTNSVANNVKSFIITGRPDPRGGGGMLAAGFLGGVGSMALAGGERQLLGRLGSGAARRLDKGVYAPGIRGKFQQAIDPILSGVAISRGHLNVPRKYDYSITGQVRQGDSLTLGNSKDTTASGVKK